MSQHHHLYKTAEWQRLREAQLREHPLCRMHGELGRVVAAGVVDHIKPHRGNLELFRSPSNLQSLCKQCHNAHKQAQEHNADGVLRGAGLSGAPLDRAHHWHAQPATQGGAKSSRPMGRGPAVTPRSQSREIDRGGFR